jgi:hypothetical protein
MKLKRKFGKLENNGHIEKTYMNGCLYGSKHTGQDMALRNCSTICKASAIWMSLPKKQYNYILLLSLQALQLQPCICQLRLKVRNNLCTLKIVTNQHMAAATRFHIPQRHHVRDT